MKQYDVKCPICGYVNHNLYLEETDGWMECEKCGSMTKSKQFGNTIRIPVEYSAVAEPPNLLE